MQASSSTAMRYCEPVLFLTLFILQSTRAMKAFAPAQVQLQQTAHQALCPLHERARIDYGTGYDPKKRPQVALRAPMYLDNVALDTQEKHAESVPLPRFDPNPIHSQKESSGSNTKAVHDAVIVLKISLDAYPRQEVHVPAQAVPREGRITYSSSGYDPHSRTV